MTSIFCNTLEQFEPRARQLMETHPQDDGTDDDNLATSVLSNAPRLSNRYNSYSGLGLSKNEEIWTIREVLNGEEQLYARGKCVYWTRNSLIIKSFNFTDQVNKVFWSRFNNIDHICVALASGLSIFDQLGRHFQMLLPFSYKEMHTTNMGILIERNCDLSSEETNLPVLFALTHPTREVSPIIFKPATRTAQHTKILTYSMTSFISIVSCHDTLPLCLMYNSQDCQHSLWRIRSTTYDEIDEFNRMNEESTGAQTNTFSQSNCSFKTSDGFSHNSLNVSNRQRSSLLHQSSSTATMNFSPKLDIKSRHSTLGNLAASRLGAGYNQMAGEPINATTNNARSFRESLHTFDTVSTPNRNRIINYLRDNIEEPILPELTIEQVWTDTTNYNSLRASKFFNTIDLVGDEYMVIVIPAASQVKVMHYDRVETEKTGILSLGRASYIQANDAAPIPVLNMMIVMDTSKNFILYSGLYRLTSVSIPQPPPASLRTLPSSSPANIKHSASIEMSPIQTSSARKRISLGDRSSIGSELSFQQIFQTLSPVPHATGKNESKNSSSPVCLTATRMIEHVIGRNLYLIGSNNNRFKVEIPPLCQTKHIEKLLNSIKAVVSKDFGIQIITSWYQTRRSATQPELMKLIDEMNLFKKWFLSCLEIDCNLFDDKQDFSQLSRSHNEAPMSTKRISRRYRDYHGGGSFTDNIAIMFYSLHLIFEDLMMTPMNYEISHCFAELLIVLACCLRLEDYQKYYWMKFPDLQKFGEHKRHLEHALPGDLPCCSDYVRKDPPSAMDFLSRIIMLSQLDQIDLEDDRLAPYPYIPGVTSNSYTVISLFCEMFSIDRNAALTDISFKRCGRHRGIDLIPRRSIEGDRRVVELLVSSGKDRNYLSRLPNGLNLYLWDAILNCRESPPSDWDEKCYNLIGRMDLVNLVRKRARATRGNEEETLKLLFPDDIRVSEAQRMLASDVPVEFSITQRQGATDEESRDETHRHLYLLNVRTMAMPLGRGAICLRTYSPVIGESFEVPRLELSGRVISEDRPIEYSHDISVYPWPFFHNGVAAGLTICESTANNIIDSTWINYNRPRSNILFGDIRDRDLTMANINNEHAGFLFALGLNGHLEKLSLMALHDYLCQNNDLTKLAILLGMSAAKRGSRDTNIIKVLSIHVDALLPPNSTELDVSASVHAASIIGVGLLYQGSGDSHISRVLLDEIGRLPGPEANSHVDRESYSLSAGLAFGLVNLCKGGSTTISSSDQLRLYMLGGKRKKLTVAQKQRYSKQDCHLGEEEYINTHITSPGGTLGLGLMYHRSHNISVANWMSAPDTQKLLEYVRPDFLIIRMLSYGLIMWNNIEPKESYIDSHIPKIVSTHAFQRNSLSAQRQLTSPTNSNPSIDHELMSQAYCNIVAGCCMTIAMRYAGTADRDAYKTIYKHTKMLIALSNKPVLAEQAGRPCIEACFNVMITSLAVVMAGTGDLGVMRLCRYLRSRLTQNCVFYGSYIAVHMALGILFLGSCRYSLSTSPEAIGALVCALYPIYPNHCSDNRYHLQALRHLYVLAAEPRLLIPCDILTNQPVYVNIRIYQRKPDGSVLELKLKSPCLVPEVNSIEKICLDDERYWNIEINDRKILIKCLFQEHGYLSVKQKAHSSNNQLVKNIETYILDNTSSGQMKSLKTSALAGCIKGDRVEQFSALNKLLNDSKSVNEKYLVPFLEQLFIAKTLVKINSLQPVIDAFEDQLSDQKAEDEFAELREGDYWTDAKPSVAHFMALNNQRFSTAHISKSQFSSSDGWLSYFYDC